MKELAGMIIAALGLLIALIPYFDSLSTTLFGVIILRTGIFSMGIDNVNYKSVQLSLPRVVVNTCQIIFGGIVMLPFVFIIKPDFYIHMDYDFLFGLFWQVVMISIVAMLLWFYLLELDDVKANIFNS